MTEVAVIVVYTPHPERKGEALAALKHLQRETLKEVGCIQYQLNVSHDQSVYFLQERWASQACLDDHMASVYVREFIKIKDHLFNHPIYMVGGKPVEL